MVAATSTGVVSSLKAERTSDPRIVVSRGASASIPVNCESNSSYSRPLSRVWLRFAFMLAITSREWSCDQTWRRAAHILVEYPSRLPACSLLEVLRAGSGQSRSNRPPMSSSKPGSAGDVNVAERSSSSAMSNDVACAVERRKTSSTPASLSTSHSLGRPRRSYVPFLAPMP